MSTSRLVRGQRLGDGVGTRLPDAVVEVPGRQQVGRDDDAAAGREVGPGRGHGGRDARLGTRSVADGHGLLDAVGQARGDRLHRQRGGGVRGAGGGEDHGVVGGEPGGLQAVQEDVDEPRVGPERGRRGGAGLVHGLGDVDLDVEADREQQRHDDRAGRVALERVRDHVGDLGLLHVDERLAHVELGPGGGHPGEDRAHGGAAGQRHPCRASSRRAPVPRGPVGTGPRACRAFVIRPPPAGDGIPS